MARVVKSEPSVLWGLTLRRRAQVDVAAVVLWVFTVVAAAAVLAALLVTSVRVVQSFREPSVSATETKES